MDFSSLKHKSDSIYSFPINEDEIEIRLLTKKDDDIQSVELIYNCKYLFHEYINSMKISKTTSDEYFDYYIQRIKLKDKRFAYIFKLTLFNGEVYYFCESGISKTYDIKKGYYDFFQVSFINKIDVINQNKVIKDRVFYQIFVDRFYKDENNHNPRINLKRGELVNSTAICGGTLKGIKEKLDYLENLGINGIYLTPIFEAMSNHKYDTINYYKVSSDFGDETTLKELINEIHKRKMIILLDGVFNHVSNLFPYFKDVLEKGNKSKYFKWFFIDGEEIKEDGSNYEKFANCQGLPRLNLNNLEVQNYIIEVGKHYLTNFHIDGFRLDVSDEIPHGFWIKFKLSLKEIKDDFILLGENWHNAHSFLNSNFEFDSIMNYAFTKTILDFVAYQSLDAKQFKNRLTSNLFRYKTNVNYNLLNLLSSHDVNRFLNECKNDVNLYLLGYAILFIYIGIPCLYYGDEIGLYGGYDPYNRECFIWDENKWNMKIYQTIKNLIQLHREYQLNSLDFIIEEKENLVYIIRKNNQYKITLVINLSKFDKELNINGQILLANNLTKNVLLNKGFVFIKEEFSNEKL